MMRKNGLGSRMHVTIPASFILFANTHITLRISQLTTRKVIDKYGYSKYETYCLYVGIIL